MFGAHQVAGDGWQAGLLAGHDGPGPVRVEGVLLSSRLPNGASGPLIESTTIVAERIGEERITVDAGTFDTVRYRFSPEGLEPEDVWVLEGSNTLCAPSGRTTAPPMTWSSTRSSVRGGHGPPVAHAGWPLSRIKIGD